jgi:hypothetical protein
MRSAAIGSRKERPMPADDRDQRGSGLDCADDVLDALAGGGA